MRLEQGTEFQSGNTYKGTVMHVDPNDIYQMDFIEINGQYPSSDRSNEAWLQNLDSELTIKTIKGLGYIAIRDIVDDKPAYSYIPLGSEGDAASVNIPAGTWYSFESINEEPLVAMAASTPPLDLNRQLIASEKELVEGGQGS